MSSPQSVKKAYSVVQNKAYVQQKSEPCEDLFEGIEVDALDKLYIQARTVMDSWVIWVFILIGALTALPIVLKKFGFTIQSPFAKKGKK